MSLKTGKQIGLAALIALTTPLVLPHGTNGEVIELSSLANLYEGVSFDHDMHIEAVEDNCSICHHHTAGTPPESAACIPCHKDSPEADSPACSSCHLVDPFSSVNLSISEKNPLLHHKVKPGLKAAFHQNCLGCHREVDEPTGCEDCHAMTKKGKEFYHTAEFAPKPGKETGHH